MTWVLIGEIIQTIYTGCELVLMPPTAFVQKPVRWLKTISKYKVNSTGDPNFAFDLCLNQTKLKEI